MFLFSLKFKERSLLTAKCALKTPTHQIVALNNYLNTIRTIHTELIVRKSTFFVAAVPHVARYDCYTLRNALIIKMCGMVPDDAIP